MTGNDRPGRACAAQSEDDMVNKVRVTIAGAPYAIATTDTENYITTLAKKLDDDITKLLDNNGNLSVTKAAVFCAMDYLDEYRKSVGSAVNELRREALDALLKKRETLCPWPVNEVELPPLPLRTLPPHRTLRARFERWEQVPEQALSGVEYLILPIAQADRVPREWREKTLLELPRVMFGALEEDTARRIAATQDAGFAGYEVSNIAHLRLCRGLPMTGGFGLNVTNDLAAQYYADLGLSSVLILPEVKDSDISTIAPTRDGKPVPTGVITYGHMPLMVTRACPLQNIHDCAHCDKTGLLTDRKAKKFPVRCGLGVRTIYNPVPIYMGDKPGALTVDYGVAYFTLESREEAAAILDSIRQHAPFEGEFTRGLYFKGTN